MTAFIGADAIDPKSDPGRAATMLRATPEEKGGKRHPDQDAAPRAEPPLWSYALVALAACVLVYLFERTLAGQFKAWEIEEYSHCYLIPPIAIAWAVGRLKRERPMLSPSLTGVAIVAGALLLKWLGDVIVNNWVATVAFLVALGGMIVLVGGWRVFRAVLAPYVFLFFTVPLPQSVFASLTAEMQLLSSQLGTIGLQSLGVAAFQEGNIIDLGTIKLEAAEACSGLRYLFPLMSFGYMLAFLVHTGWRDRTLIFAATIPITILMNAARIITVGYTVDMGEFILLDDAWHWAQGFAVFLASLGLLALVSVALLKLSKRPREAGMFNGIETEGPMTGGGHAPSRAQALGLFGLCAAALLIQSTVLASTTREVNAPPRQAFADWPMVGGTWLGQREPLTPEELRALHLDDYLLATFTRNPTDMPVGLYMAYYAKQEPGSSTHSPLVCLPGSGWKIGNVEPHVLPFTAAQGGPLKVNRAIIQKGESKLLVYFWYREQGSDLTSTAEIKWNMVKRMMSDRRSDGALIRLITPVSDAGGLAAADIRLTGFLGEQIGRLSEYVP